MSEKSFRIRGTKSKAKELTEKLQELKVNFWNNYKKQITEKGNDAVINFKKFEKELKQLEYEIYCAEYEESKRRNWK